MQTEVYKMRRFLAIALSLICIFALASCAGGDDAPEGLQLADDNKAEGYTFYAPEGWTVSNRDGVSAAFATSLNRASITFTRADAPTVTLKEYFDTSIKKLPFEVNITKDGEKCTFGNSADAYKYIYTYKYDGKDVVCMQILVTYGERFYIFTYTSYGDPSSETSDYRIYLEPVQLAIDNFAFKTPEGESTKTEYPKDSDGYCLVSDEKIAGFELYLPESYTVVDNAAIVTASISGGANISITKTSVSNVSVLTYLENRRAELSLISSSVKDIKVSVPKAVDTESDFFKNWTMDVLPELDESTVFGNLSYSSIVAYEYTYEFAGSTYHVYQVLGIDSWNGYVFTYTARESEFAEHLEEIKTILKKVKF